MQLRANMILVFGAFNTATGVLALLLAAALPLAGSLQTAEINQDATPEIVISARKMRIVRLSYSNLGPQLRRCDILVSSGERRVDNMVCEILRACVRQGQSEAHAAHVCVNNRIGILERQGLPIEPSSEDRPASESAPSVEIPAEQPEEVLVTANLPSVGAGMWQFEEQGTQFMSLNAASFSMNRGKSLRKSRWRLCVRSGNIGSTLFRMVDKDAAITPKPCRWRLQIADGRIAGNSRCMRPGGRVIGNLEGQYSRDELILTKQMRYRSLGGGGVSDETWLETRGKRIGKC